MVLRDELVTVTCAVVPHPLVPVALAYRFDCPDRSIVISGDTAPSDAVATLAKGADVLVHETLWTPAAPGAPGSALRTHIMNSHTPVEDAGRIAARAGVGTLVLSHIVPTDAAPPDDQLIAAAKTTFAGRVVVGKDLLEL
jgi:ribonuclease BN (tRNA processing enzyme)